MRFTKDEKYLLIEAIQFLHDDALESANEQMGGHYYDEDAGVWTRAGEAYNPYKMAHLFGVTGACEKILKQVKTKPGLFSSPQKDHFDIPEEFFPMIAQALTLLSTEYAIEKRAKVAQKEVQETDGATPELEELKKQHKPNYNAFQSLMKKLKR
jgi:hypothetical protein